MKHKTTAFSFFVLLLLPSIAQANAGTPLMWASILHLTIGNAIIGLLEGLVLARLYRIHKGKAVSLLILANYLSAWLGVMLVNEASESIAQHMNINSAWRVLWIVILSTYAITLVIEFPFLAAALYRSPGWFRKAICGTLIVQTLSYTILFGWYWTASGTSLYTRNTVVELSSIDVPDHLVLYYISADDGDVYERPLTGIDQTQVFDLDSEGQNDRLLVQRPSIESTRWDLAVRLETDDRSSSKIIVIRESFALIAVPSPRSMLSDPPEHQGTWFNFGQVPKLGEAESSPWQFRTGFWPIQGLSGDQPVTEKRIGLALETPFARWAVRNATHLPGDKVVFQLGADQICIYDPDKRRVALVVRGRGPIVVLKEPGADISTDAAREIP
jgi:hypothetical protein